MNRSVPSNLLLNLRGVVVPGVTRYAQLRQAIVSAIDQGYWKTGDRLPAERDIAQWTSLSLGTVQRALRDLADQGIVVRAHGSGTFVNDGRAPMEAPWHARFLNDDESGFLPVFPSLILRKLIRKTGPWTEYLGTHRRSVVRIDRRLNINDEFSVYSKLFMSADRFGQILSLPASEIETANLKMVIKRVFHLPITRITQRIVCTKFSPSVAKVLKVRLDREGLLMECMASAGANVVVYYQELYIPPNHRRLVVSDSDDPWMKESASETHRAKRNRR